MPAAYQHPEIINNYFKEEIECGCFAGPFDSAPFNNFHFNWFGIIPKSTPGKWRLIP